ncbi:MAG: SHOCT domain-containing protein [Bacillota bacterium]|nr:SHOCT domain-containing protein [Bacillota bacterium]
MMILPLIVLILVFLYFIPSTNRTNVFGGNSTPSNNALEILDRRFANGEINEEEYLKRKSILKQNY